MSEPILNSEERFGSFAVNYLIEKRLKEKYVAKLAEQYKVERSSVKTFRIRYILKIAASFVGAILCVGLINYYLNNSIQSIANNHIQSTNILGNQSIMRKDVSLENSIRINANAAFVLKDYEAAVIEYSKLKNSNIAKPIDYFYLGVSEMRIKNVKIDNAIASFNEAKKEEALIEETEWFLSLAYILKKDYKNAETILEAIILRGNYKTKEALELLALLKKKK